MRILIKLRNLLYCRTTDRSVNIMVFSLFPALFNRTHNGYSQKPRHLKILSSYHNNPRKCHNSHAVRPYWNGIPKFYLYGKNLQIR